MGEKKAFLRLGGKLLISHVIDAAREFSTEILIVTDEEKNLNFLLDLTSPHVRVVSDVEPGKGPLIAVYSGLQHTRSEYCAILPCDSPFVKARVMLHLEKRAQGMDGAVPLWPNGYIEPLHSIYKTSAAREAAEIAIREGNLRVSSMVERLNKVALVPVEELRRLDPELLTFFNINDLTDLRRAEAILSSERTI